MVSVDVDTERYGATYKDDFDLKLVDHHLSEKNVRGGPVSNTPPPSDYGDDSSCRTAKKKSTGDIDDDVHHD